MLAGVAKYGTRRDFPLRHFLLTRSLRCPTRTNRTLFEMNQTTALHEIHPDKHLPSS